MHPACFKTLWACITVPSGDCLAGTDRCYTLWLAVYGHFVGLIHKTVAVLMFWRELKQFACIQSQCHKKLGEQQLNSVCRPTLIHIAGIV